MMKRTVQLRAEWLSLPRRNLSRSTWTDFGISSSVKKEQGRRFTRQVTNGLLRWMRPPR